VSEHPVEALKDSTVCALTSYKRERERERERVKRAVKNGCKCGGKESGGPDFRKHHGKLLHSILFSETLEH